MTSCFRHFLSCGSAVVYQRCVAGFAEFAESASHEDAVSKCLPQNEETQTKIVSFLSKVSSNTHNIPSQSLTLLHIICTSHFQISSGSANEAETDRSLTEEVNKARLEIMKIYWEDCSSKNLSEERKDCLEVEFKCEEVF